MKNIAVIPNLTKKNSHEVTLAVCDELKKLGASIMLPEDLRGSFEGIDGAEFVSMDYLMSSCSAVIAVGGDGTILHSAKAASEYGKPVLGVNTGRLGYMAGLEKQELSLLSQLINDEFLIDERMMLKAEIVDADGESKGVFFCINDAVIICRAMGLRMVTLCVSCNGEPVHDYLADGIIISTPTGSTAYSLSAGGAVLDPLIEGMMLTPICAHSFFSKSLVFSPTSQLELVASEENRDDICICCDGGDTVEIGAGSRVIITRAEKYAKLIRIKNDNFIKILHKKLAERRI